MRLLVIEIFLIDSISKCRINIYELAAGDLNEATVRFDGTFDRHVHVRLYGNLTWYDEDWSVETAVQV